MQGGRLMSKTYRRNPVAKHAKKYNKSFGYRDRKRYYRPTDKLDETQENYQNGDRHEPDSTALKQFWANYEDGWPYPD
jgi:tagatose-1,6-bisphosphate aldolase non-catalytic subunit AgaZ/GatZ